MSRCSKISSCTYIIEQKFGKIASFQVLRAFPVHVKRNAQFAWLVAVKAEVHGVPFGTNVHLKNPSNNTKL
jgi:hypothetical protein